MNAPKKIYPHYTYDDWVHWKGKWELIEGYPHAMSPAPVPNHQRISSNLSIAFGLPLMECNKFTVYQPLDYKLTEDTILQPDLLIACKEITKQFLDFPPSLVVEILSPSTAYKDRHIKYTIYESQAIKYYVIVVPDKEEVEIYELLDGAYKLKQSGKNIVHEFFFPECTALVEFKKIW